MSKFLKKVKELLKQGWASAEVKAEIKTLYKELETEEQEAVSEEAEAVEGLPEENPEGGNDDEAVKSILKSIDQKIKVAVEEAKAEMDAEVKKWQSKQTKEVKKTASLNDLIENDKVVEFTKSVKKQQGSVMLELKDFDFRSKSVPADMGVGDNYDGTVALSELDPMVSREPQREPFIEQLVTVGTINSPIDVWIETTDEEGNPLPVAELAEIPQKDYDFKENSAQVRKIGVHAKYSAEMAEDLPNLIGEVRNFLISDLRRVVDTQILTGNGLNENLTGILENATAYSTGSFAGTIINANRFDVIETAVTQVLVAHHNPNFVVVHPVDKAKMNLAKAGDGHYVMPPFIASSGQVVSGVRVISNTGITAGTFLVGDFSKSSVKYRRGLTVELTNTDQDDFVKDRFTVKATVRLVHRVRENDYEAFVTGNFDTAISALEAGS